MEWISRASPKSRISWSKTICVHVFFFIRFKTFFVFLLLHFFYVFLTIFMYFFWKIVSFVRFPIIIIMTFLFNWVNNSWPPLIWKWMTKNRNMRKWEKTQPLIWENQVNDMKFDYFYNVYFKCRMKLVWKDVTNQFFLAIRYFWIPCFSVIFDLIVFVDAKWNATNQCKWEMICAET